MRILFGKVKRQTLRPTDMLRDARYPVRLIHIGINGIIKDLTDLQRRNQSVSFLEAHTSVNIFLKSIVFHLAGDPISIVDKLPSPITLKAKRDNDQTGVLYCPDPLQRGVFNICIRKAGNFLLRDPKRHTGSFFVFAINGNPFHYRILTCRLKRVLNGRAHHVTVIHIGYVGYVSYAIIVYDGRRSYFLLCCLFPSESPKKPIHTIYDRDNRGGVCRHVSSKKLSEKVSNNLKVYLKGSGVESIHFHPYVLGSTAEDPVCLLYDSHLVSKHIDECIRVNATTALELIDYS